MFSLKKTFQLTLIAGTVTLLTACGPIYETQYSYAPPRSSQGMMCINNCTNARTSCEQMESMRKESCEYRAELTYQLCTKNGDPKHCYREGCYSDYEHCKYDYNACFQGCGGTITSTQVCVAFCK